ncbi:MAG: hypothetical protein LDL13_01355 [Calditerrivibrio sp.]|nr:hypothetical protein [Calditerrivibrio sp.]MCA1932209.1 hypothetical protein [Calditerrivibrio sp.]
MTDKFYVGDIFESGIPGYECKKLVIIVSSIMDNGKFYLINFSSLEPWSEKFIVLDNRFEKFWLTFDEVKYLAETDDIKYAGNIKNYKNGIVPILKLN